MEHSHVINLGNKGINEKHFSPKRPRKSGGRFGGEIVSADIADGAAGGPQLALRGLVATRRCGELLSFALGRARSHPSGDAFATPQAATVTDGL